MRPMSIMNARNYTSTVPAAKSQAAIEKLLVEAGAVGVSKFFNEAKQCNGFLFQLPVGPQLLTFKLPVRTELLYQRFIRTVRLPDARKRKAVRDQAERTAWKTLHEWVHIQVDMILTGQMKPLEIMLAQQYDEKTGTTFFERVEGSDLKLLN